MALFSWVCWLVGFLAGVERRCSFVRCACGGDPVSVSRYIGCR